MHTRTTFVPRIETFGREMENLDEQLEHMCEIWNVALVGVVYRSIVLATSLIEKAFYLS